MARHKKTGTEYVRVDWSFKDTGYVRVWTAKGSDYLVRADQVEAEAEDFEPGICQAMVELGNDGHFVRCVKQAGHEDLPGQNAQHMFYNGIQRVLWGGDE